MTISILPMLALVASATPSETAGAPALAPIVCTPTTIVVDGRTSQAQNPIAAAIQRAKPGQTVDIQAGTYPPFAIGFAKDAPWNARTSGGKPGAPITVRGLGTVRIKPSESGDTIAISQDVPNGHFVFENLQIVPGGRAGIMFYKLNGPDQVHDSFKFYDCSILGTWDHLTQRGGKSKWGVWGHSMKDFEFVGRMRPAEIRDIRAEHGFYIQNTKGDILIDNVHATRLGRTFCQFTARKGDGPPGVGNITVRNCVVEDVAIAAGDNYKGGAAFTVAGRVTGTILFENNTYKAGFDRSLLRLTARGAPYGTGAFVCWDGRGTPNGLLILRGNTFTMARGCGDRPLVSIGGCRELRLEGRNQFVSGNDRPTLDLDPMNRGKPGNTPIGKISISPSTVIEGEGVYLRGARTSVDELAKGT